MRMILAILAVFMAFAGPAFADKVSLIGDVTYRERIALPPGGSLTVSLVDLATPTQPRVTVPVVMMLSSTERAVDTGIAKPIPMFPPLRE